MNRDDFIDQLKQRFAEEIHEAYLESEHEKGVVDFPSLKKKIEKIAKAATVEGMKAKDFHELACSTLPRDIVENLYPEELSTKAS